MGLLAVTCTTLVSSAAFAQGVGFQGGMTINPEQVYVGTHVELPLGSDQIVLRPAIDGGFGSGLRVAAIGAEIQYRIELGNSGWRLSQGFGPGVYVARFASGFADEEATEVSGAWTYAFGIVHEGGFFTEFKGGGSRSFAIPMLRIGAGFTIRPERR
ncbi:MAG: hypothetical protein OXQ28_09390 [Acidobacteriota bacterium]|nr:hypothetical protein [Acidobacteriota bacterium]